MSQLLEINSLTLDLPNGKRLLNDVTLHVGPSETVGLVGESGSGKSLTARAVLGLFPDQATLGGSVVIDDQQILGATTSQLLGVRRSSASMIFQDPRAGVNPMRTIGDYMTESLRLCHGVGASKARKIAIELLRSVRLPRPEEHLSQHPHEFSGGMLQRVMIAGALTSSPKLLICDEPTTALDVTTQAEIMDVLREQRAERGMGMLFITHDLNLAASICDRVYVMKDGELIEQGTSQLVFGSPVEDYTKRLIAATPSIKVSSVPRRAATETIDEDPFDEPMVVTRGLAKTYHPRGRGPVHAVAGASITIPRGRALGVVGESGSGKSTLARLIIGLEKATAGDLSIGGRDRTVTPRNHAERIERAKAAQMVFQDPYLSLDRRIPAGKAVEDALKLHTNLTGPELQSRVIELLASVGLKEEFAQARPRTLSGGQRQRVAIARALAVEPELLVLDEATSALDVSVQAQVLDLIANIRKERGLTVLFISHDLGVVRRVCDETVVMKNGEIVESGPTESLLMNPQNPYTQLLIDSVPSPAWSDAA